MVVAGSGLPKIRGIADMGWSIYGGKRGHCESVNGKGGVIQLKYWDDRHELDPFTWPLSHFSAVILGNE